MRSPGSLLLDTSIYFSFDRSGLRRHARQFNPDDLDVELSGQRCLVTGANSGIGYATAEALARRGAEVRLLCRNEQRGRDALERIERETGSDRARFERLDISDLAAVRRYAASFDAGHVDRLIHNAGVLPSQRRLTADGLETAFATHVAGPALLTALLRDRLQARAGARVIWVSSGGMYAARLSLADLDWSERPYRGVTAYAQTKRMQVVLSELFAEKWRGSTTRFHAMHPGWADTPAVRTALPRFWAITRSRLRTPAEGADTVIWLSVAPQPGIDSGLFWFDRRPRSTRLLPFRHERPAAREALWELCRSLQGQTDRPG